MFKVKWRYANCSGTFGKSFDEYEDAENFAQIWLMDAVLSSNEDSSVFDYQITKIIKNGEKNHV
jgi:hypothetical protein